MKKKSHDTLNEIQFWRHITNTLVEITFQKRGSTNISNHFFAKQITFQTVDGLFSPFFSLLSAFPLFISKMKGKEGEKYKEEKKKKSYFQ